MKPWNQSPQTWIAYGLQWEFRYNKRTKKRTIDAPGIALEVPIAEIAQFPSPQAWIDHWEKKSGQEILAIKGQKAAQEKTAVPERKEREAVEVEVLSDELTEDEERERLNLERKVERAFYDAGQALRELRDRKLYRSTHPNFEAYCRERFGYNRSRSYQLIDAASVVDTLQKCPQIVDIFPTREGQVRPLSSLAPNEQIEAWQQAVEQMGGKVPPARVVKSVVDQIRERHPVPNPWHVGDVCQILVKENPDLRGRRGCWALVTEVHDFSCTVQMWDKLVQVKVENLKDLAYSPQQKKEMVGICARLSKIPVDGLSNSVKGFLAGLGKLDRPYLTALEETILGAIEVNSPFERRNLISSG